MTTFVRMSILKKYQAPSSKRGPQEVPWKEELKVCLDMKIVNRIKVYPEELVEEVDVYFSFSKKAQVAEQVACQKLDSQTFLVGEVVEAYFNSRKKIWVVHYVPYLDLDNQLVLVEQEVEECCKVNSNSWDIELSYSLELMGKLVNV